MARPKGVKETKKRNRKIPSGKKDGPREQKVTLQSIMTPSEQQWWNKFERVTGKQGGPPLFEHPDQMIFATMKFFEWCDNNPIPQSDMRLHRGKILDVGPGLRRPYLLVNFCHFCGVTHSWYGRWKKRIENHPDFGVAIEFLEEGCKSNQIEGATVGQFNANMIALMNGIKIKNPLEQEDKEPMKTPELRVFNTAPPFATDEATIHKQIADGRKEN